MSKFLDKIGHFFTGLFNAAKRAYNKLSPEQQDALVHGTGLISLINSMAESTAEQIRAAITLQFPNLDEAKLEAGLFQIANQFGLAPTNIDEAIEAIKTKLAGLTGKFWAIASHNAASIFAVFAAPIGTKVAAIVSLIEYAYQKFHKKSI
jgi:hypothetical protein